MTMADVLVAFPGASARMSKTWWPARRAGAVAHAWRRACLFHVAPGMAVITVQFEVGVKYNDAVLRLHDTMHSHRDWLAPNRASSRR